MGNSRHLEGWKHVEEQLIAQSILCANPIGVAPFPLPSNWK